MIKTAVIALLAASAFAAPASAAPVVWSVNGHSYEYVSSPLDFAAARAAALAAGGYLANVTSADEYSFIQSLTGNLVYFGGSDEGSEGVWSWLDGPEAGRIFYSANPSVAADLPFDLWNPGEPNNSNGENALVGNWNGAGWNDINSGNAYGYVIERGPSVAAVPEPSTWALMLAGFGLIGLSLRSRARRGLAKLAI